MVQREYDEMEEKEAEEIVLLEVEVEKEAEENVMVNQTSRSNQLLEEKAKEIMMVNQAPSSNQLLEEAKTQVSVSACLRHGKI